MELVCLFVCLLKDSEVYNCTAGSYETCKLPKDIFQTSKCFSLSIGSYILYVACL